MECTAADGCQRVALEAVNLPPFLAVDVPGAVVTSHDDRARHARIERVQRENGRLVLQGGQAGRAWTMLIGEGGALAAAIVDGDVSFTVFGHCTASLPAAR
jgi:hypothetical protein